MAVWYVYDVTFNQLFIVEANDKDAATNLVKDRREEWGELEVIEVVQDLR